MSAETWSVIGELAVFGLFIFLVFFGISKLPGNRMYRWACVMAMAPVLFMLWVNLAVGIIGTPDNPANLLYFAAPAVGILVGLFGRLRPKAMLRACQAAIATQILVFGISLFGSFIEPRTWWLALLIFNGILIGCWSLCAWLFSRSNP